MEGIGLALDLTGGGCSSPIWGAPFYSANLDGRTEVLFFAKGNLSGIALR